MRVHLQNTVFTDHPIAADYVFCAICGQFCPNGQHICLDVLRLRLLVIGKEFETLAQNEDKVDFTESMEYLKSSGEHHKFETSLGSNRSDVRPNNWFNSFIKIISRTFTFSLNRQKSVHKS